MTVPGIGPIISSAMVAAIGSGDVFSKGRDLGLGSGWYRNRYRPAIARSSAAYQNVAIGICARCSFKPPGSCWSRSSQRDGSATGSSRGSKRRSDACTAMCWRLRSPTSLPASPGQFSTRGALSSASKPMRPELLDPRAAHLCTRRPGRTNGHQARTKEQLKARTLSMT